MANFAAPKSTHLAFSRRNILSAAASSALVAALGIPAFALAGKGETPGGGALYVDPLTLLDESLAEVFVGSDFDIRSDTANATLRLSKVHGNSIPFKKAQGTDTQTFTMEFEVLSSAGILQQDTYNVLHPKLGAFDLFIVPNTNGKGMKVLLATFSRIR